MAKVFAPASIGNVGPGFDILGLSFHELGDIIEVELTGHESSIDSIVGRDATKIPMDPKKNCAVIAAEKMLEIKGIQKNVRVSIERALPVSGGLGASAASSVGGALAAAAAAGVSASREEVLIASLAGEEAVAGKHLDNIAPCLVGGLTLVLSVEPPKVYSLPIKTDWWICVLTPNCHVETKEARKLLPKQLPTKTWVEQMKNSVAITTAFATGDSELVKESLVDLFSEPNRSHLIPGFDQIKDQALAAGSLGCSISGSGPTIFALFPNESTARLFHDGIIAEEQHQKTTVTTGRVSQKGAHII